MVLSRLKNKINISRKFQLLKNKYVAIFLAYFFTLFFIAIYFIEGYTRYSFLNMPIGWDTPWYITSINIAKSGKFSEVIQRCSFTNFVYPIAFSLLPLDAFSIEKFVPIGISFLVPAVAYFLTEKTSRYNGAITIFLTSIWFAIYRMSSDLHANLLGVVLLLSVSGLIFDPSFPKKKKLIVALGVFLSSFVHFETTLFFSLIILPALINLRNILKDFKKRIAILAVSIVPALLLYAHKQYNRLQTEGTIATGSRLISSELFENSLGVYLFPFIIAGLLFLVLKKKKNTFDVFTLYWSAFSFLLILLHYFVPISNFAYRALLIFPSPFLLAPLIDLFAKKSFSKKYKGRISRIFLVCMFLTTIVSASSIVNFSLKYYPKMYVTKDMIDELIHFKEYALRNYTGNILFIYNLDNPGIVELYDNWVSAIIADHLSYYGNFYDLLQMKEGYNNLISRRFYNNLREKLTSPSDIFKYNVVFLKKFYNDESVFRYITMEKLYIDTCICNLTNLITQPYIMMAVQDLNFSSFGHWYVNEKLDALEIYSNETQDPYLLLYLDLPKGHYNLSLTYWDGSKGNGLKIFFNDELKGLIDYKASSAFRSFLIENVSFDNGAHVINVLVFKQHIYQYFARLGSITVIPNPFKIQSEF